MFATSDMKEEVTVFGLELHRNLMLIKLHKNIGLLIYLMGGGSSSEEKKELTTSLKVLDEL